MNIFELFEKLDINKSTILTLTLNDIIRIEKQINIEQRINPEIEVNTAFNLITALRNYPQEFYFIASHKNFYNWFAKTNYPQSYFENDSIYVTHKKVKLFIEKFLQDDLILFFDNHLSKNQYKEMNTLLLSKADIPTELLYTIETKVLNKVETIIAQLNITAIDKSNLTFLTELHFYDFLTHFSSLEIDKKVTSLLNSIAKVYNSNKQPYFETTVMISMANYKPFDQELEKLLKKNKKTASNNLNPASATSPAKSPATNKNGFAFWWKFAVLLLILIFGIVFATITKVKKEILVGTKDEIDKRPEFPGGLSKFYEYVGESYQAPEREGLQGKIIVTFVVEIDGSLTDIKVIQDIGYGTGDEAIRVLSESPKWQPGEQNGKKVRVLYSLPITIQLAE